MDQDILNNALNLVNAGSHVLFVWSGQQVPTDFQNVIGQLQAKVGDNDKKVSVEHSDRLDLANYEKSTFDLVVANLLTSEHASYNAKSLSTYLRLLKPKGVLIAVAKSAESIESELKLNGYTNVSKKTVGGDKVIFQSEKPNFEVGASSKLKFASKPAAAEPESKPKVWQFGQDDIQESDLIDTDELLDDLDLKKPVISDTKFDCGTSATGKKKACKNCTCGLAEEIESEAKGVQKKNVENAKSACGSCYLGDAFRCASCPYLGMPAFKPGEKIQLSQQLLKPDL